MNFIFPRRDGVPIDPPVVGTIKSWLPHFDPQQRYFPAVGKVVHFAIDGLGVSLDPLNETDLFELMILHHIFQIREFPQVEPNDEGPSLVQFLVKLLDKQVQLIHRKLFVPFSVIRFVAVFLPQYGSVQ